MSEKEAPARTHTESFHISVLDKFNYADGKDWPRWIRRWVVSEDTVSHQEFQVNTQIYFMGDGAKDILNASTLNAEEELNYTAV